MIQLAHHSDAGGLGGTPPNHSGSVIETKRPTYVVGRFVEMGGVEPPSKQSPR